MAPLARCGVWLLFWSCLAVDVAAIASAAEPAAKSLGHAHAHNDYWHDRPLLDALDRGFASVEADVALVGSALLIGHEPKELRPERTLESLYLAPLRERIEENDGRVHPRGGEFFLLIDVKSDAEPTYAAIHDLLAKYANILTTVRGREVERKAVTVVISGNRAEETIREQPVRYAGIDGRPKDLALDDPPHVLPWISANWNERFRWRGDGPMPDAEQAKLRDWVAKAHAKGRLVRFWATPEDEAVWKELLAAEVDLIGTDDLDRLRGFLVQQQ